MAAVLGVGAIKTARCFGSGNTPGPLTSEIASCADTPEAVVVILLAESVPVGESRKPWPSSVESAVDASIPFSAGSAKPASAAPRTGPRVKLSVGDRVFPPSVDAGTLTARMRDRLAESPDGAMPSVKVNVKVEITLANQKRCDVTEPVTVNVRGAPGTGRIEVIAALSGISVPSVRMPDTTLTPAGTAIVVGAKAAIVAVSVAVLKPIVGAVMTLQLPGDGGTLESTPDRKRSPPLPVSTRCNVNGALGGTAALAKRSVSGVGPVGLFAAVSTGAAAEPLGGGGTKNRPLTGGRLAEYQPPRSSSITFNV